VTIVAGLMSERKYLSSCSYFSLNSRDLRIKSNSGVDHLMPNAAFASVSYLRVQTP